MLQEGRCEDWYLMEKSSQLVQKPQNYPSCLQYLETRLEKYHVSRMLCKKPVFPDGLMHWCILARATMLCGLCDQYSRKWMAKRFFKNQISANNSSKPANATQQTWSNSKQGFHKLLPNSVLILKKLAEVSLLCSRTYFLHTLSSHCS